MASGQDARSDRFRELFDQHADKVYRFLRNRASSAIDVEGVVADVLTVAWVKIDRIPVGAEAPWLYAVARNRLMNEEGKLKRRARLSHKTRFRMSTAAAEEWAIADLSLREAIGALSATDREVVLLSVWEQLSTRDIAVALGITPGAAAVRLTRAMASLRGLLGNEADPAAVPRSDSSAVEKGESRG